MALEPWSLPPLSSPEHQKIVSALVRNPLLQDMYRWIASELPPGSSQVEIMARVSWAVQELAVRAFLPWTPSDHIKTVVGKGLVEHEQLILLSEEGIRTSMYLISIYDYGPEGVFLDKEQDPIRDTLVRDWHIILKNGKYYITESGKQFLRNFWLIDRQWDVTIDGNTKHLQGARILPLN